MSLEWLKGVLTIDKQIVPDVSDLSILLPQLTRPQAFPCIPRVSETIELIQTHASAVLLVGEYAYKLKKARDFGFFDYSTPERRHHFCEQEVILNSRLAPQIYLGVAPLLAAPAGTFSFGQVFTPGNIPMPGTWLDTGQVIDYAVVMLRLPEEATLAAHVARGTATPELLEAVAEPVARFHMTVPTSEYISDFGSLHVVRGNWDENFTQMRPYIGRSLAQATFDRLVAYIYAFLDNYASLFTARIHEQRIRDCHGDLRLQHVYILRGEAEARPIISIVDCIEFNERFRYSDVAAEVAFLAMELDAAGRSDLARSFVKAYVACAGDQALSELLPFYICYRACVRGKVLSFQLDQPEVPAEQREAARQEAEAFFNLAVTYASGSTRPTLLLVGGLMGTGKSTLASRLQADLGWTLFSSDTTRKELAQLEPHQPQSDQFGEGLYSAAWSARTYQTMFNRTAEVLAAGRSVILDATFASRSHRHAAVQVATLYGANLVFIECQCPRELSLQRLAQRWQARVAQQQVASSLASDARPDLYDSQVAAWQPFDAEEERVVGYLPISTVAPSSPDFTKIFDVLSIPRALRYI